MTTPSVYRVQNLEIAAFIEHRTKITPTLKSNPGCRMVEIEFPASPEVVRAAMEYTGGCPEARLLATRARLYRRIREVLP
jgi:hypothetical protein